MKNSIPNMKRHGAMVIRSYFMVKVMRIFILFVLFVFTGSVFALSPEQVLVVYNETNPTSEKIARYYIGQRNVPKKNLFPLKLQEPLADSISRKNYNELIALPIRKRLERFEPGENIRCLLLIYGVPYKVGAKIQSDAEKLSVREILAESDSVVSAINALLYQVESIANSQQIFYDNKKYSREEIVSKSAMIVKAAQKRIKDINNSELAASNQRILRNCYNRLYGKSGLISKLQTMNNEIAHLSGEESSASVDSELSLVMYCDYELSHWQVNGLKGDGFKKDILTKMVCRLDGPDPNKIMQIADKSKRAEISGLHGVAYFDSRNIPKDSTFGTFGYFDQSIRDAAEIVRSKGFAVVEERTESLFQANECPDTALYCGWYSLKNYIDSFTFNDGAIGYHIASWEAVDIRDANSSQWCPSMLEAGISATLGAVSEPYLHAFPEPDEFFSELFNGLSVVEAFYKTKSLNSWQLVLIADPLYKPFGNKKR